MTDETPDASRVEAGLSRALLAHQLRTLFGLAGERGFGCVLDVGAHRGQSAKLLRDLGHRGRIVSFEPHPASYAELEAASAGDPGWEVRRLALGSRSGSAELLGRAAGDLSSLLPNSTYGDGFDAMRLAGPPVAVEIARLDEVLAETPEWLDDGPVLLKVDVQGTELAVLEGAGPALGRLAAVQVELAVRPLYEGAAHWRAPIELLERAGFELSGLVPVGRDRAGRIVDIDCLMVGPALPGR